MATHNFRRMEVWKNAMELTKSVYNILSEIPNDERFGLKSQISRCSVSVPSNIAEGSGRTSEKEFLHFLNIAISSSYELETQLILVYDIYNIETKSILTDLETLQKMIGAFKRTLITG